ncbi:LysR family transcriptional regulator [Chenggangzhangella methanolivorans]|uniref:LysR family transcriptional regulator n=1 Tax=Chenggangzhangella methanolivorans TaxID=1437009 RepID=A0A9E6RBS7_9HYPH|nr:LysR family transcriptional regulator [Chenggangzhangella methanolivorans]QZO01898.1 LysR family transcriptional regulator [Chenggangzhangella methanolivorans]
MSANTSISHDDVRLVASIARATSMRRAQAAGGGHLATLYRRLRDLEARIGGPLFERRGERLVPTARAEPFLDVAAAIEDRLAEVERRVAALDDRLVGPLTVTTADTLAPRVCACLKAFGERHPQARIALDVGAPMLDLARREADVAIRPTTSPPETLMGRRAGSFDYAAYRAKGGAAPDRWIGYHGDVAAAPAARWLAEHASEDEVGLRVNSLSAAAAAAAQGWGRALLPDYMADDRLERVGEPIAALRSELWVLFHPDLRANPRVRIFAEFAAAWFRKALA